jgi:hypothetical protein
MAMARRPVVGMTKLSTAMRQRLWPVKEKPIANRKLKRVCCQANFLFTTHSWFFTPFLHIL